MAGLAESEFFGDVSRQHMLCLGILPDDISYGNARALRGAIIHAGLGFTSEMLCGTISLRWKPPKSRKVVRERTRIEVLVRPRECPQLHSRNFWMTSMVLII